MENKENHFLTQENGRETRSLPFTISIVKGQGELLDVVTHRQAAYARELPDLAAKLGLPEEQDKRVLGREILVARSKLDGAVIGSLRLHTSQAGELPIQSFCKMPGWLEGKRLIEATRLSVTGGLVCRSALFKALVMYSQEHSLDHCVVAARPRISVIHESICFSDLFEKNAVYKVPYANDLEHRIMHLPLGRKDLESLALSRKKALHEFFFLTDHGTDIDVSDTLRH